MTHAGALLLALACFLAAGSAAAQDSLLAIRPDAQVGSVQFRFPGSQSFSPAELGSHIALRGRGSLYDFRQLLGELPLVPSPGSYRFDPVELQKDVVRLRRFYQRAGFSQPAIDYEVRTNDPGTVVDVSYVIEEGPRIYVERINITGNVRSEDKILRRELPMREGDLYTLQAKERARQKLVNLGYFETVNVNTQPGTDKTRIIVNVEVVERATGIFSIGGGYSSVDSLVGTIDLAQRNFLGRGWEVAIRIRAGAVTQQGTISFTDPWLFDRPLSGGFDVYKSIRDYQDYTYDTTGLNLRMSHPFAEYWRWHTGYRLSQDIVDNLSANAAPDLVEQEGTTITSAIGASRASLPLSR